MFTIPLCRCLAYESVQQVHLYEPSGHLKQSRALLEDALTELAQQQGRSVAVKVSLLVPLSGTVARVQCFSSLLHVVAPLHIMYRYSIKVTLSA
jgi:hypothetical protein